jgi:hypothetical protein
VSVRASAAGGAARAPWVELVLSFPASAPKVLMLNAAERAAAAGAVRPSTGITRALVVSEQKDGREALKRSAPLVRALASGGALAPLTAGAYCPPTRRR